MLTGEITAAVVNSGSKETEEEKGPVGGEKRKGPVALANGCLLVMGAAGGGALLVWWVLSFHRSNAQLWMVPVGLVLVGTPVTAWISVFASAVCRNRQQPLSNSDPER